MSKLTRGFVDGSLSTLGIVVGASSATPAVIIAAGLGGTLANGLSNALGAFSAERAGDYRELRQFENAMVDRELKQSLIERRMQRGSVAAGVVDAAGTMLGGIIPVAPYLAGLEWYPVIVSALLVVASIALVGLYLGRLARRNVALSACKMAVFGGTVAGVVYVIQRAIVPQ